MKTLTIPEIKAAQALQRDMPLTGKPFDAVSADCGLTSLKLITFLKDLSENGILRKFGAILRHQKAGYQTNALVVWSVSSENIEEAGQLLASLPFISHCYERSPAFQGRYNLFTMLHSLDNDMSSRINEMSRLIQCNDFLILESLQEYKKTSPEYF